jgi:acylphosphatase
MTRAGRVRLVLAGLLVSGAAAVAACGGQAASPTPTTTRASSRPTTSTEPAVRRVHVYVSGVVQGVGFRNFTLTAANRARVTGWVRNLRDGRVEAVIEGPPAKVAEVLDAIHRGPPAARVDEVVVTAEPPTGEFKFFTTRSTE